jgi:hypothetical protein
MLPYDPFNPLIKTNEKNLLFSANKDKVCYIETSKFLEIEVIMYSKKCRHSFILGFKLKFCKSTETSSSFTYLKKVYSFNNY